MIPRFVGRLGPADAVSMTSAALGFAAAAVAIVDPGLAARLVLLAAVADGLDGVIARKAGSTDIGPHLDALADVVSFCVAPALFVVGVVHGAWGGTSPAFAGAVAVAALFVVMGVVRLGMYTVHDPSGPVTVGVPTTLAGTVLAALYLAGLDDPTALLVLTALFAYLMVTSVRYPDLYARDAVVMGAVQVLAVAVPAVLSRLFPRLLLAGALGYLLLGPWFYWRDVPTGDGGASEGATDGSGAPDRTPAGRKERRAPERKRS